ncbi:MAG: cell wall metabolism sensor histidine kinase WalK [Clostridiaceae bacterium]|nr:cell wall metabolism sensor histidine kinase WalK [Clostridiaceae bacterium]
MIRTLFGKILTIVLLVLIISFTITGFLMNAGLKNMIADQKAEQLDNISEKVIAALETLLRSNTIRDPFLFNSFIQILADNTDTIIWILREDGAILFYSNIPGYVADKLEITEDGRPKLPDERQFTGFVQEYSTGDFYGLFESSGVDWITRSEYFKLTGIPPYNLNAKILVMIHAQLPSVFSTKSSVFIIFILSGLVGSFISFLFVALLSRRIVRPVKQMKDIAKRVASGEFGEQITVKGRDEIAELSESFNNMVVSLKNLEQMRRDFIGNVSHELRTPITTIKGFVEGILDGVIEEERQAEYLSIVRDEVRRMQNLVNDLLDLAKMQGGETKLNISVFDVNELVRRCVISLQQMFIEKNLEFNADFEQEKMLVKADKEAIQRVIINLLHNAIKFTPESGRITVRTLLSRDKVTVSVEDTGKGIPENELKNIFERFYKTDKSRSEDRAGVGLGLAIVKNIIMSHNETIKVESKEGDGSKFIFTLRSASLTDTY